MWLYHRVMSLNDADGKANSVDPDQTAPLGAVWSGSALFAQTYLSENLGSLWYSVIECRRFTACFLFCQLAGIEDSKSAVSVGSKFYSLRWATIWSYTVQKDTSVPCACAHLYAKTTAWSICLLYIIWAEWVLVTDCTGASIILFELSPVMRKPVFVICEQQRGKTACTFAQSDQRLCCSLPG